MREFGSTERGLSFYDMTSIKIENSPENYGLNTVSLKGESTANTQQKNNAVNTNDEKCSKNNII